MEFVNVTNQAQLDKAVANGDIPVCWLGYFGASDSATVHAYGSATVHAYGSATVHAYGSATVRASDSATVHAYGSATVHASRYVGVTRHGTASKVSGGVLIQVPEIKTLEEFCAYYGIEAEEDAIIVYKLVSDDLVSGHGTAYPIGEEVPCPDWSPEPRCGNGLHFSPRAFMARVYSGGTRFVACRVKIADAVVIGGHALPDKIKARSCVVLHECDEDGQPLVAVEAA